MGIADTQIRQVIRLKSIMKRFDFSPDILPEHSKNRDDIRHGGAFMKEVNRFDYDRDLRNHRGKSYSTKAGRPYHLAGHTSYKAQSERKEALHTQTADKKKSSKKKSRIGRTKRVLLGFLAVTVGILIWLIWKDYGSGTGSTTSAMELEAQDSLDAGQISDNGQGNPRIVCIDAGHGGNDVGAEYEGKYEKDSTLMIARLVQEELESQGIQVVMTRTTDTYVELSDRVRIAKEANAGLLVSIHRNYYAGGSSARGIEAWIHSSAPADSSALASDVLSQLKKVTGASIRGLKTGTMTSASTNYYINNHSSCASCILELGFITNSQDNELVTGRKNQCAKAIANGILDYINSQTN